MRLSRILIASIALSALATPATAQKMRVAVLSFTGPQGVRAQAEVVRALRKQADIVQASAWEAAARRLFAVSRSADDVAAVAKELQVKVVVTGGVKREGAWVLSLSVRNGLSGKSIEKLRYPLRGPRIDPPILRRLADEIGSAAIRAAEASAGMPDDPGEGTEAALPPGAKSENEDPLAGEAENQKKADGPQIERPSWSPYVDASVGLFLFRRDFTFEQANSPQFHSTAASGLRLDLTAFPLAFLGTRPGDLYNGLTGIGVGVTFDYLFWPDSKPCFRGTSGNCDPTDERYATREYRLEAGLRWHWNLLNKATLPDLQVSLQYGLHSFTVQKRSNGQAVGPPDVGYSYISLGLGTRIPFADWIGLLAAFHFHGLLDGGSVQGPTEYGAGGGYGLRAQIGLEARPWHGLTVRAVAFYERFGLSFNGTSMPPATKSTTGGATDQYVGAVFSVGYVY
ncbi:MAG: hypothetical protein EXR72_19890 [Myxococcales bacterium]|nr:hypothetical protein [Myxococcales bacterium]